VQFRAAELHPLMALAAIISAISGAFVSIFYVRFHPSIWVIPAHVLLVLGLLLGAFLAAATLRSVYPVIFLSIALCALYVVNAIAWVFWIVQVSLWIVAFYVVYIRWFY